MSYTKGAIANLLDFNTPNVGYEDADKRDVCGCCGTHYVVGVEELSEVAQIVTDLCEACKGLLKVAQWTEEERKTFTAIPDISLAKMAIQKAERK